MAGFPIGGICGSAVKPVYFGKVKKKLKKCLHFRKRYNIICFVDAKDVENGIVQEKNAPLAQLVEHLTLNQGVQGSSPWRRTKELFLGTRSLGDGSFFVEIDPEGSGFGGSFFIAQNPVKVGYTSTARDDLISEMQIAASRADIFMAHKIHETVDIDLTVTLILVKAVVRGEIMAELMGRELKRERSRHTGHEKLDRIACERLAMEADKDRIGAVRAGSKITAEETLGDRAYRDSPLFASLAGNNHPGVGQREPGTEEATDL